MQLFSLHDSTSVIPAGAIFLLGYFDGVHRGHQLLLDQARAIANDAIPTRPIVVWSLATIAKSSAEAGLLTTTEEKCALFRQFGADFVLLDDFDAIRALDGETFFRTRIAEPYRPYAVVCGENFRFGHRASCGASALARFARACGVRCMVRELLTVDASAVSSTEIRRLLTEGDVASANALLGYAYTVTAPVTHGKKLGRTIGTPTINQRLPAGKIAPARGVYACTVTLPNGETYSGVANLGSRPTVNADEGDVTLETHILDYSGDLYDCLVTTALYAHIRPEQPFASVEALSAQIHADAAIARTLLEQAGVRAHTKEDTQG